MKIIVGGIVEKEGKVLLVQEAKESCKDKWNISTGSLELGESITQGALREIKEETGCDVELTGILSIVNVVKEDDIFIAIIFSTKLLKEEIKYNPREILDAKWFDIDEIIENMKNELRAPELIKPALVNLKNGKISSLYVISEF